MLTRLLAISLCVQLARACVPMRPGEETPGPGMPPKPCPAVPVANAAPKYVTSPVQGPTAENGAMVYKCAAPASLLSVDASGTVSKLSPTANLACKDNSGKFVLFDGTEKPADGLTFICGKGPCDGGCPDATIDETGSGCASTTTATNILCTSRPMMMTNADNCPALSCPMDEFLYLVIDGQAMATMLNPADVICNGDKWLYTATDELPVNGAFVCAKAFDCKTCQAQVGMFYTNSAAQTLKVAMEGPKPQCLLTCPPNFRLINMNMVHESVYCDTNSKSVNLDSSTGAMLSLTNKFDCVECNCQPTQFFASDGAGCPSGLLCARPEIDIAGAGSCVAKCPAGSTAVYKDANGMEQNPATITCTANNNWIEDGMDTTVGVTCKYTDSTKGWTATPPAVTAPCPPLGDAGCTGCIFTNLIYVADSNGGYAVMCKMGSLVTDQWPAGAQEVGNCPTVAWGGGITTASCDPDPEAPITDCNGILTDLTAKDKVIAECSFGSCNMRCPTGMTFRYMEMGGTVTLTATTLKCSGGIIEGPFNSALEFSTIRCV